MNDAVEANPGAALPAGSLNPVDYDGIREGGTLTTNIRQWQTQWKYTHVAGMKSEVNIVTEPILPRLYRADDKVNTTNNPDYVTDWKSEFENGKQVVTYRINEEAVWSDGEPITYRDFQVQWKALNGANQEFQASYTQGYENIESVERGVTDKQVVVTFAKPYPAWRNIFTPLYPASTNDTPEHFDQGWVDDMPVTAGPFVVAGLDPATKTVTFVRNPDWWGRRAKLDKIVFRVLDDRAATEAYTNGELDALDMDLVPANLERVKATPNTDVRKAAGGDWRQFTINGSRPVLRDVRVRRAVVAGIDREAIARADLEGMDWPVQTLDNHVFMNTQEGYADNSAEFGGYDVAKANALLDEAGWKWEDGVRRKDGRALELCFVFSDNPVSRQEGEMTRAMLAEIGVRVVLQAVTPEVWDAEHLTPGNFDITPFSWLGTPFPLNSLEEFYKTPDGDNFRSNFPRIGTPELDRVIDECAVEFDRARQVELGNRADRLIWEEAHTLPLYQRPQVIAARKDLANYGAMGFATRDWSAVGYPG